MAYITRLITPLMQPDLFGVLGLTKRGFGRTAMAPTANSPLYNHRVDDSVDAVVCPRSETAHDSLSADPVTPSRGIALAVLLSIPLWIVIVWVVRALMA